MDNQGENEDLEEAMEEVAGIPAPRLPAAAPALPDDAAVATGVNLIKDQSPKKLEPRKLEKEE